MPSQQKLQQKIKKIDNKVISKIQELQDLMVEGGLTESAEMLDKCLLEALRKETGEQCFNLNSNASRPEGNLNKT